MVGRSNVSLMGKALRGSLWMRECIVWGGGYSPIPLSTPKTQTFRLASSPQIITGVRLRTLLCNLILSLQKLDLAVKGHTNRVPRSAKWSTLPFPDAPLWGFFPPNEPNKLSEQNVLFKYGSTSVSISYFWSIFVVPSLCHKRALRYPRQIKMLPNDLALKK